MTINSYKMGPGTMTLGTGPLSISAQVTSARVTWSEESSSTDAIDVLSGEQIEGDDDVSYVATLEFTLLQDLAAAGAVAWSWTNKGTEQAFKLVPNTTADRGVTGTVRPIPLAVGGDVKSRPTSDASWKIIGDPVLGDATP